MRLRLLGARVRARACACARDPNRLFLRARVRVRVRAYVRSLWRSRKVFKMDELQMIFNASAANNAWSAQQAQKQMDFQERMSNTAHQREVADLKAAGLNPVLSAAGNGAAVPAGAKADADGSLIPGLVQVLESFGAAVAQGAAVGASSGASLGRVSMPDVGEAIVGDYLVNGSDVASFSGYRNKLDLGISELPGKYISKLLPSGSAKTFISGAREPATAAIEAVIDSVISRNNLTRAVKNGNYQITDSGRVKVKNTDGTYTIYSKKTSDKVLAKHGRSGTTTKPSGFSHKTGKY